MREAEHTFESVIRGLLETNRLSESCRPLLETALTHRSWSNEARREGPVPENERLEFLGDAVLGLVVTQRLFGHFPGVAVAPLAKAKARLVSEEVLVKLARSLHLGRALRLGLGEERSGGRDRASLLGDALEAVVGAVYLAGGLAAAEKFVLHLLEPEILREISAEGHQDYKSRLQEYFQKKQGRPPEYREERKTGPDHAREYEVSVWMDGKLLGRGQGRSKKMAAQIAAEEAWKGLRPETKRKTMGDAA